MNSSTKTAAARQSGQKRRRSRKPDWETFYKNGLPKEIIVIDDSPAPEDVHTTTTTTTTTKPAAKRPPPASSHNYATTNGNSTRHVAKKRKREDDVVNGEAYYYGNSGTPHQNGNSGSGSISTDRTTSAVHTTAATSLSSNSQYGDYVQAGHKRKRTRQQVATESKRREVEGLGDAYISYQPPPYPPKKAGEVPVRVIQDVRLSCLITGESSRVTDLSCV
jgi:dual-specificity kinase